MLRRHKSRDYNDVSKFTNLCGLFVSRGKPNKLKVSSDELIKFLRLVIEFELNGIGHAPQSYRQLNFRRSKHGEVWSEGKGESEKGDARAQERQIKERTVRKESDQPQTGNRHRPFRGTPRRRQGAAQKIVEPKGEKEINSSRSNFQQPAKSR
jgi:hypothetical protein